LPFIEEIKNFDYIIKALFRLKESLVALLQVAMSSCGYRTLLYIDQVKKQQNDARITITIVVVESSNNVFYL
jgi:uncharacterized membrane protein YadS